MSRTGNHGRREFLKGSAASVLAAGCWGWPNRAASAEDAAHVHGMVIAGEQAVYLSHLPLFSDPHDYQVILEATFAKPGSDPQADYFADRKRTGTQPYTLEPEPFVLPGLAAADAPLRSFKANVYRGQYEQLQGRARDSARIGRGVQVNVTRVIHFRKFDPAAAKLAQLEYLLFGKGTELLLAHLITRPPDFDQILSVKVLNHNFTDAELDQGTPIVVPGRLNSASRRIKGTEPVKGQIKATGGAPSKALQLQPGLGFYFNDNDDLK